MERKGLCHICGALATSSCKLCGKLVCKDHMNSKMICKSCASGRTV